jgi:hypothetical protein
VSGIWNLDGNGTPDALELSRSICVARSSRSSGWRPLTRIQVETRRRMRVGRMAAVKVLSGEFLERVCEGSWDCGLGC